ncbi:unnamed protein product [Sphagnum jensenii]|uniref:Alpha-soluble NSF attachment protein n=1 Tax=Sphagnum jensenii TaxID=128206 RepID=A0ABP0WD92_9BRYO
MADQEAKGAEFEKKADKKLSGWLVFGTNYDDAAELLEKAANSYKLAKSWDKAASAYIKLANCQLKLDSKHEAASAYVDAANCYKKSQPQEAVQMLNLAIAMFEDIGRFSIAAKHYKGIADIYEKEEDIEKAMDYYDRAAQLYSGEGIDSTANQCKIKVAQFAAELEQYDTAIEIYEDVARQSMNNSLLKYGVKGYLLNAGLCQICGKDVVGMNNALEKYQELDPTFSSTRECKLLMDLVGAIDEVDVVKFTDIVRDYDNMSRIDQWKTTLLLRAKNTLKLKEVEEPDFM